MRNHIKLFESQEQEIHTFMNSWGYPNYTITPEGVDYFGDISFYENQNNKLEFQFNLIHGNFGIANTRITSLQNGPRVVEGDFDCSESKLDSLLYCPKFVQGDFYCYGNNHLLGPWEHRYLLFSEIHGNIETELPDLDLFFKRYQNQKALIPEALKELRELQIEWDQKNA